MDQIFITPQTSIAHQKIAPPPPPPLYPPLWAFVFRYNCVCVCVYVCVCVCVCVHFDSSFVELLCELLKSLYVDGVRVSVSKKQSRIWVLHGNEFAHMAKFVLNYS